jgi:hypothetical protein
MRRLVYGFGFAALTVLAAVSGCESPQAPVVTDRVALAYLTQPALTADGPPQLVAADSVYVGGSLLLSSIVGPQRWSTTTPELIAVTACPDGTCATIRGLAEGSAWLRTVRDTLRLEPIGKSGKWRYRTDSIVTGLAIRVVRWCGAVGTVSVVFDRDSIAPGDSTQARAVVTDICGNVEVIP